jgi:hypothetical protein
MPFIIVVIISAIWVFIDARSLGVKKGLVTGLGDISYFGWFVVVLFLWIIALPMYLYYRPKYKKILAEDTHQE